MSELLRVSEEKFAKEMEDIASWYKDHQVVREGEGRWLLKRPGTNEEWCEVAALARGTLLVHGDHDHVLFGHNLDCECPEDLVHWMARDRPDNGYFLEKARIAMGSGSESLVYSLCIDKFQEELEDMGDDNRDLYDELDDIRSDANSSSVEDIPFLQREIMELSSYENDGVPEGRVVSTRMIHAWAILNRLSALLKEKAK